MGFSSDNRPFPSSNHILMTNESTGSIGPSLQAHSDLVGLVEGSFQTGSPSHRIKWTGRQLQLGLRTGPNVLLDSSITSLGLDMAYYPKAVLWVRLHHMTIMPLINMCLIKYLIYWHVLVFLALLRQVIFSPWPTLDNLIVILDNFPSLKFCFFY